MLESLPVWLRLVIGWAGVACMVGGVLMMRGMLKQGRRKRRLFKVMVFALFYAFVLQVAGTIQRGIEFGVVPLVDYRIIIVILIVCSLVDSSLTRRGLYLGAKELNPVGVWMIKKFGYNWSGFLIILFLLGVGVWMSRNPDIIVAGYALLFIYCLVLMSNAWQLRGLRRKRARVLVVRENTPELVEKIGKAE